MVEVCIEAMLHTYPTHPTLAKLIILQTNMTKATKRSAPQWAHVILASASQDGRVQPWKETFRGHGVDTIRPGQPDLAALSPNNYSGN